MGDSAPPLLCGILRIGPEDKPDVEFGVYTETDKDSRFTLLGRVLGAPCRIFASVPNKAGEEVKQLKIDRAETQELGDLIFDPPEK